MRKYTLILGGIFLLSLALSLFLAVSTMITILTIVAIALFKRIKQKKK